jgi:hypothetical protein
VAQVGRSQVDWDGNQYINLDRIGRVPEKPFKDQKKGMKGQKRRMSPYGGLLGILRNFQLDSKSGRMIKGQVGMKAWKIKTISIPIV